MNRLLLKTPSRLHFGLLSWGDQAPRQFGGVGLMVNAPGLAISAEPGADWSVAGALAPRILQVAHRVASELSLQRPQARPLRFRVEGVPLEHVGLGLGTQLGMAVARLVTAFSDQPDHSAPGLARLAGRGLRSGIGLHGFALGGLIVDGGRARGEGSPTAPLLARLDFPVDWSVLIVIPPDSTGLHGSPEIQAFRQIPPLPEATADRLGRLVLLDMLPAVIERDLLSFGTALSEIQLRVGQGFAPAQGGLYARPDLAGLVSFLRAEGLAGVGQSSWGPTLYGFFEGASDRKAEILVRLLLPDRLARGFRVLDAGKPDRDGGRTVMTRCQLVKTGRNR